MKSKFFSSRFVRKGSDEDYDSAEASSEAETTTAMHQD
jgi:hypothetical protein